MEKKMKMIIDEFLLERPVEPFTVGVHFGRSGISMPMFDVMFFEDAVKLKLKLASVVRERLLHLAGQSFKKRTHHPARFP